MNWIFHNHPTLEPSDEKAVQKALKSGWVAQGNVSRAFEQRLSVLLHRKYARATSSGTAALHLALLALKIKPGEEVILPTYACTALLNAVSYVGAKPKLADIDERNLGLSKRTVKKLISRRTRAVILNHTFGFPADIAGIRSFGIPVIEDCAQGLGSEVKGKALGSSGNLTVCSFYATKMITSGYGGMVLTDDPAYARALQDLTRYDQRSDYKVRYNYSLSDMAAALGLNQLQRLNRFLAKRRTIANRYQKALATSEFFFWSGTNTEKPNFYRFVAGSTKPYSEYVKYFRRRKIQVISPLAPYQLLHRYLGLNPRPYPVAEYISRTLISLPIYPSLKREEIDRVDRGLRELTF